MAAAAPPTGCFKCGRPGHWSRDCPSAPASSSASYPKPPPAKPAEGQGAEKGAEKKKRKERVARPKLTVDLLLSDDGLGYVLRHFPKAFRCTGRPGHEVEELGNLIRLYTEWHSHLIPYYSFEQFVSKVEQLGASKRVRRCIAELRERVARGGDPTKLNEQPVEEFMPDCEPDESVNEDPISETAAPKDNHGANPVEADEDPPLEHGDVDPMQEDLLNDIYHHTADQEPQGPADEQTIQETPQPSAKEVNSHGDPPRESQNHQDGTSTSVKPAKMELTGEQRARMEANRLRALERAAARARAAHPSRLQQQDNE